VIIDKIYKDGTKIWQSEDENSQKKIEKRKFKEKLFAICNI